MGTPELSVVVPFFNEEAVLPLLRRRWERLEGLPEGWELVLVSDGSTDGSVRLAEDWAAADPRVKLLVLTRNFGHQAALCAGLDAARGRFAGIIDADLQDPPEELLKMRRCAEAEGWDVVFGVRASRAGSALKSLGYGAFYRLYALLAESPVDPQAGDFCVLSRRAIDTLASLPERQRFLRGLRSWTGLRSKAWPVDRPERAAGEPRYSWARLASLALDGLTSFSARPLRLATWCGAALCALSMALTCAYLVSFFWLDLHSRLPGFTTLVILMLSLSGVQFLMLGILGEYVARIFQEVKRRPVYLVERSVNVSGGSRA